MDDTVKDASHLNVKEVTIERVDDEPDQLSIGKPASNVRGSAEWTQKTETIKVDLTSVPAPETAAQKAKKAREALKHRKSIFVPIEEKTRL